VPAPSLLTLFAHPYLRIRKCALRGCVNAKFPWKHRLTPGGIWSQLKMMTTADAFSITLIYSIQIDGSDTREGILQDFNGPFCLNLLGKPLKGFGAVTGNLT
jgi:hypothetical protein